MDNLTNKTIKQFYFDTDYGKMCITCVTDKDYEFTDFYGHIIGWGTIQHLIGWGCYKKNDIIKEAKRLSKECYDILTRPIEDEILTITQNMEAAKIIREEYKESSYNQYRREVESR
jgi:hypothetical protein